MPIMGGPETLRQRRAPSRGLCGREAGGAPGRRALPRESRRPQKTLQGLYDLPGGATDPAPSRRAMLEAGGGGRFLQ